ncbi:MAG: Ig-like domain-containing protein [Saprospiraceae bacterium]|nr:Ig-like domain-containing protein [Saprospiraceae bacterium]
MGKQLKLYGFFLLSILVLGACVNPRMPSGGDRDQTGPRLDSMRYSTPNLSTNFTEKEVILTFDEWVKLNNANNEIIISPPLENKPKIKVKYKSVVVKFEEELKENTTYVINYGKSIQDITENNSIKDMSFVFSTGAAIDSLETSGKIINALDNQPKKDVLVMLYDNLADSTPIKERPYYFARTDEQGKFKIKHIKADTFRIFALEDKNNNYKYDQDREEIAFLDSSFITSDSVQPYIQMRMFKAEAAAKITAVRIEHYACARISFNQVMDTIYYEVMGEDTCTVYTEMGKDSMRIYLNNLKADSIAQLVLWDDNGFRDTLDLDFGNKTQGLKELPKWSIVQGGTATGGGTAGRGQSAPPKKTTSKKFLEQHPKKNLEIRFNQPFTQVDQSKIQLVEDSSRKEVPINYALNPEGQTGLDITNQLKEGDIYELTVLPNAITGFYGISNPDTIRQQIRINRLDTYGTIIAKITNADSSAVYVAELMTAGNQKTVLKSTVLTGQSAYELTYPNYAAQNYVIRLIIDENQNGKWDVGNYLKGQQPEGIFNSKVIKVRASWDNEMEMDLAPKRNK